ncbi:MAG: phosphopantetheine-binding protein [Porticoccaceae bacterium]
MDNNDQPTITEIVFAAVLDNHAVKKAGKVTEVDASMLLDDLKVDSLEKLSLAMDFEDQFSIEITDEEIEGFLTVGDFITYLERAVAESAKDSAEPTDRELSEQPVDLDDDAITDEQIADPDETLAGN